MLIRRLDRNTYDVFGGIGWPSPEEGVGGYGLWTRVRRFHWGLKPVAGAPLSRPLVKEIFTAINSCPNGSIENINTENV